MPPRTGQLDEISEKIGRIDAYVHEGRHGINNLSQKLDALSLEQAKRHEALKLELAAQMDKIAAGLRAEIANAVARISKLEDRNTRDDGARSVKQWIIDHSPWATLAAIVAAAAAWLKHP